MSIITGELNSLKASEKNALQKISTKRCSQKEVINAELLKSASAISHQINRQIALLIGRDGKIFKLIVGEKRRLYLPDLGRYRLSAGRLRKLRLVVLLPGSADLVDNGVLEVPADFQTDLEKLRFDGLLACEVDERGEPGHVSYMYLQPKAGAYGAGLDIVQISERNIYDLELDFRALVKELDREFSLRWDKTLETQSDAAILLAMVTGAEVDSRRSMDELRELARSAGVNVVDEIVQKRRTPDPRTVFGRGKLEDIVLQCLDQEVDLLIFDRELSPSQLRQITNITELRVVDRSMLILDIFSQRAKSAEGRLQVELAQLKYSLPRLTDKDSGLSRLSGGIGGRGPGETKLEVGRRRARSRISDLEKKLEKVSDRRALRRSRRQRRGVPVISIVGYTNAGKSTLLNALTKGDVLVEDKLFATLDPSSRRMRFPNDKEVVFVDTVGFIRELPKELINAFQATLEELDEADLLLHVVDVGAPEFLQQIEVVEKTLGDLDLSEKTSLLIYNKADTVSPLEKSVAMRAHSGHFVSALRREGFAALIEEIQDKLAQVFNGQDPSGFLFR